MPQRKGREPPERISSGQRGLNLWETRLPDLGATGRIAIGPALYNPFKLPSRRLR